MPFSRLFGARLALRLLASFLLISLCGLIALLVWMSRPCPPPLEGIPFSACILDRDGRLLRVGLASDGRFRLRTSLEMLPGEAIDAVLHYEDRYFWYHPGVNLFSLVRAGLSMLAGGRTLGGSTLTMQVVRLKYNLRTGSLMDKLRQMALALRLEWHYDKKDILEAYFTLAPYGGNVEGLAAAARVYFHKDPRELSLTEILSLVPVPQNPVRRRPSSQNPHFLAAAARLQEEYARRNNLQVRMPLTKTSLRVYTARDLPLKAMHLTSELLQGGLSGEIRTTLNLSLQELVERRLSSFATRLASFGGCNAAALLVHWPTRHILALAGSSSFFNEDIDGQVDITSARRSPGSTLKPFIYALALEQGLIHSKTLLLDLPRDFAGYEPENFDGGFQGPLPADTALRLSRNVPAISLAGSLASPGLYGFLQRSGVDFAFPEEHYGLSIVLGGAEVTARELAALYATLADGGIFRPLTLLEKTSGAASGAARDDTAQRLLSPEAAFVVTNMLGNDNPDNRVRGKRGNILPLRVKTGTSNGLRDAWTCGIFGPYVLVVWVGNADNSANPLFVGARTALPLFRELARAITAREDIRDLHEVPGSNLRLSRIPVCSATGDINTDLCPEAQDQTEAWFIPGVSPVRETGILRKVRVNSRTGLLSCPEDGETSHESVAEFWPSELKRMYARAGIQKPDPPAYGPLCDKGTPEGHGPRILLPREGVRFHVQGNEPFCSLVLLAHAEAGVSRLFWFCDTDLAGVTTPGEELLARIPPGEHTIRVVDEAGRSATRRISIGRMP